MLSQDLTSDRQDISQYLELTYETIKEVFWFIRLAIIESDATVFS